MLNILFGVMSNVDCNTVVFFANALGDPRSSNNMSGSLELESETGEPESNSAQRLNERRFAPLIISDHKRSLNDLREKNDSILVWLFLRLLSIDTGSIFLVIGS